jgi:hypothetical protein
MNLIRKAPNGALQRAYCKDAAEPQKEQDRDMNALVVRLND